MVSKKVVHHAKVITCLLALLCGLTAVLSPSWATQKQNFYLMRASSISDPNGTTTILDGPWFSCITNSVVKDYQKTKCAWTSSFAFTNPTLPSKLTLYTNSTAKDVFDIAISCVISGTNVLYGWQFSVQILTAFNIICLVYGVWLSTIGRNRNKQRPNLSVVFPISMILAAILNASASILYGIKVKEYNDDEANKLIKYLDWAFGVNLVSVTAAIVSTIVDVYSRRCILCVQPEDYYKEDPYPYPRPSRDKSMSRDSRHSLPPRQAPPIRRLESFPSEYSKSVPQAKAGYDKRDSGGYHYQPTRQSNAYMNSAYQ